MRLLEPERLPHGARGRLNIGVFADRVNCTVELEAEELLPFAKLGWMVEVTFYPVEEV
jgi:hypothetical protein